MYIYNAYYPDSYYSNYASPYLPQPYAHWTWPQPQNSNFPTTSYGVQHNSNAYMPNSGRQAYYPPAPAYHAPPPRSSFPSSLQDLMNWNPPAPQYSQHYNPWFERHHSKYYQQSSHRGWGPYTATSYTSAPQSSGYESESTRSPESAFIPPPMLSELNDAPPPGPSLTNELSTGPLQPTLAQARAASVTGPSPPVIPGELQGQSNPIS
ncbi:hypothetical protein JAAARDRAFT_691305 [Jaapia argillacea MUCL 33604]|uniref:Uncharacterized protein n=1 Tax=Jaapia argillacea MUCL 33604 TaxID=933084 RepID=A0A067PQS1_9AGAM|nr:hypothetical protein JAAARDRAFT_691305 [Jaapia argillacea MUCL 33604]